MRANLNNSKMRTFLLLLTVLVLQLQFLFADTYTDMVLAKGNPTYTIYGSVKDRAGVPLPFSTIVIQGSTKGTTSDGSGNYHINSLTPGDYVVEADFLGYKKFVQTVSIENSDCNLNIVLEEESQRLEDVVVYGSLTRGQAKALNVQKKDLRIINVVDYEQFAKFPDRNTADALQRIPGISITKDQGEGEYVMVRGLSPEYNSVQLNGQKVPSPDKDDARGTGMGLMLADMMQSIVVYKTMSADMDGDAIGGTVDFNLKEAPDTTLLSVSVQAGFNAQHSEFNNWGKDLEHVSLMYGDRYLKNNKLGLLVSGSFDNNNIGSILNQYTYDGNSDKIQDKRWNDYDVHRTRYGFIVSPDFKFNEKNKIRLLYTYNQYNDDEIRRRADFLMTDPAQSTLRRETRNRIEKVNTSMLQLSGEHYIKRFKIDYTLANIHSNMDEPDQSNYRFEAKDVDLTSLTNSQKFDLTGTSMLLPSDKQFTLTKVTTAYETMKDRDNSAKINFTLPFNMLHNESKLKAGFKWVDKKKNYIVNNYTGQIDKSSDAIYLPDGTFGFTNIKTEDGKGIVPVKGYTKDEAINSASYDASERIASAYFMGEFRFTDNFTTVAGVRYENTRNKYYHYETDRRGESSYGNVLPSVTLIYNLSRNSNVKAAYSKGISRPGYSMMVPYYYKDEQSLKINEGNPDLKPAFANSFDLLFEHYTNNLGMVTAGVFYKKMNDQINSAIEYQMIDGDRYEVTKPINMGSAKIWGAEVALNKRFRNSGIPFIKHTGIYANYTFTRSQAEFQGRKLAMSSSPEHVANLSLFFDHDKSGWSFALTNVYRSSILSDIGADSFNDVYYGQEFNMDFSVSKRIWKNLTLSLQVNNLTDQPAREYLGDPSKSGSRIQQTEYYGRRYIVGLVWKL